MIRDPHDYTIEVCVKCGAQLDRGGNGRCPVNREHWSTGGMVVRVIARPADDQDVMTRRHFQVTQKGRQAGRKPNAPTETSG